jgi:hypothetical protein
MFNEQFILFIFIFKDKNMSKIKTSFNVVEETTKRLAVLIDAGNASVKAIKAILEETTHYGEATVKRIYGNFVSTNGQ